MFSFDKELMHVQFYMKIKSQFEIFIESVQNYFIY